MNRSLSAFFCLVSLSVSAATYYVTPTGNDGTGTGSQVAPWRTIQQAANTMVAGDTVNISTGDYPEYVTTVANGSSGSLITFQANPTNAPFTAKLRGFRVGHRFITVKDLVVNKSNSQNGANIRVEPPGGTYNGSDCLITNNLVSDTPLILTHTAQFGSNYIQIANATEGVDFNTAGFTNGSLVWLGSDSLHIYTNFGTAQTVLSNSANGLMMFFTNSLLSDPGSNYWVAVISGGDNSGSKGILAPFGSSSGASNLVVVGNTFSNLMGPALIYSGNSNRVMNNTFTRLHGQYAMQIAGPNSEVGYNLVVNNPSIEWFTPEEINAAPHGGDARYYDWQCNIAAEFGQNISNVVFHHNWIQDCDNALGMFEPNVGTTNWLVQSNVWVGCYQAGGFDLSGLTIDHNTFYRCGYTIHSSGALVFGAGLNGITTQDGLLVSNNVIVDYGDHSVPANELAYGNPVNMTNYLFTNNFVATYETINWTNVNIPTQGGMVTNGDPLFVNAANPLGPDGLPFTADDGLRPLPNSKLAAMGIGALTALPTNSPVAHFRAKLPAPGWQDKTGTNFNLAWAALSPDARGGNVRPWATPEALGILPAFATFDASGSVDGFSTNNSGIKVYVWDFGDGSKYTSPYPTASHTFSIIGTNTITLTITNSANAVSVFSNSYRVLSPSNAVYVAKTGNDSTGDGSVGNPYLTIQKGIDVSASGSNVVVQPGIYAERLTLATTATPAAPITITANGAVTNTGSWKFNSGAANIIVSGFESDFSGVLAVRETSPVLFAASGVSNVVLSNFKFHDTFDIYPNACIDFSTISGGGTNLDSAISISNCYFHDFSTVGITLRGSNHIALNNTFSNSWGADAFGVWGHDHIIKGNYCTQIGSGFAVIYGSGNAAFNGTYYDNLALRQASGHSYWTNANGYAVYQDSAYLADGFSNFFNVILVGAVPSNSVIYASAPSMNGTWTIGNNAAMVTPPASGRGAVEHPDFIQTFGVYAGGTNSPVYGQTAYNILIDGNTVVDGVGGAIAQLESNNGNLVSDFHDWTFQNNLFANVELGASITMLRCKWFNNTFYRCAPSSGALSFGWVDPNSADPRGSSDGGSCSNNAFIGCAYLTSNVGAYSGSSNGVQILNLYTNCDYNFVCKTDYTAEAAAVVYPTTDMFKFYEPHGINGGNPQFINEGTDFRLATNSVLVGKGVVLLTSDLLGNTRPSPPSIGAFETATAPPPPPNPGRGKGWIHANKGTAQKITVYPH